MRKLFILIITLLLINSLFSLTIGVGVGVEDLGNNAYGAAKVDAILPLVSFLDARLNLLFLNLSEIKINLGTGIGSDIIVKFPLPIIFQPYIPFGFSYFSNHSKSFNLKGGIGIDKEFILILGYLEGGFNLNLLKTNGTSQTTYFYFQGGIKLPLGKIL